MVFVIFIKNDNSKKAILKFLDIQPTETLLNPESDGKIQHFDGEI